MSTGPSFRLLPMTLCQDEASEWPSGSKSLVAEPSKNSSSILMGLPCVPSVVLDVSVAVLSVTCQA